MSIPLSVARVCIDSPLPHLDRLFDYSVPEKWQAGLTVGTRVRVAFAGRLVSAVVIELGQSSTFDGTLAPLKSVAARPSYSPESLVLAQAVARRYGGSLWDVLRLMAPPRVASVEKRPWSEEPVGRDIYARAAAQLAHMVPQSSAILPQLGERVVWEALPAAQGPSSVPSSDVLMPALAHCAQGRSAIVVVPDERALAALEERLESVGLTRWTARSGGHVAVMDHDHGPAPRYGAYMAAMLGKVSLVIGTRPSVMQPMPDLGVLVLWDESSSTYEDPHAPYPHARTVAAMRSESIGCALMMGGYGLSVDAVALVEHGWATLREADRTEARERTAAITVVTDSQRDAEGARGWHWMPGSAWRSLSTAIAHGPVAVVVPRAGYVQALACARCQAWAACTQCEGTLRIDAQGAAPVCVQCDHVHQHWHCPQCHSPRVKQVRQGVERIAEQLAQMAPDWPVQVSTGARGTLADGSVTSGLVVATPGALPAVQGGYSHVVVVGAQLPPTASLGAELAALRWWLNVAAMVRSRRESGVVTLVGELPSHVRQALVAWAPAQAARDEYQERRELLLPPVRRVVELQGEATTVQRAVAHVQSVSPGLSAEDLTVVPSPKGVMLLMTRSTTPRVVDAVRAVQRKWSREGGPELRIRVDVDMKVAA